MPSYLNVIDSIIGTYSKLAFIPVRGPLGKDFILKLEKRSPFEAERIEVFLNSS